MDINLLKLNFTDKDFSIIENIRKKVFSDEMNIPKSKLFDEHDETCDHYILFDGKKSVGSIRFLKIKKEIKLERMAILAEFRGKNYGKSAILQLIEYYHMMGNSKMILDSIFSVRDFYKKCGFIEEGEIFQRVGIDHIRMSFTF
jgi:predicted GNAT family N-acyltransferase|tara:strand:- start:1493 stop:1924 length:432 start_codon:yes stop_codon:yes gene_type:complete